jgi:UPF0176 protein
MTASGFFYNGAMSAVLNISSYLFVTLDDTAALREHLHAEALARDLKGTVLIAEEGINLFLAGPAEAVRGWVAVLRADPRFAALEPKESWSETVPFKKLLVKVKREIIRMNHPTIRPDAVGSEGRAPAVDPGVLRQWLTQGHDDEGRPVVTLDTRNAFEVDYGTFEGAVDWRISKFSEFPEAVQAHKAEFEGKTVVSFCTGGIRCEKAALYMQEAGIERVYQLEGGILKYFELTDGAHWHGDCFVFDEREALAANLQPGGKAN